MAEVLEDFEFSKRSVKYNYDEWFNGKIWKLTEGVDFDIKVFSMCQNLNNECKRRGYTYKIKVLENAIVIQVTGKK